jgi:hypothetical protein
MSEPLRRSLSFSLIAAALALLAGAPAGAFAAAEESSDGSTPGGAVTEPTQPAGAATPSPADTAPASTEWSPKDAGGGTPSGGAAPLEHGSSVGSGVVTEKARSDGVVTEKAESGDEPAPYAPASSGSHEAEPSIPPTPDGSTSTPPAKSGIQSEQPRAAKATRAIAVAVGTAISLGSSASPQDEGISSAPPAAAASFVDSGDHASTGSQTPPLLLIIVLALILGLAGVGLGLRHRRRRFWREQDAAWEAARWAELGQVPGAPEPSAQRLQRINAG